jgi:hypothetical protein
MDLILVIIGSEGVGWIYMALDRTQWLTVVIMVINLQVSQNASNVGWYSVGTYSKANIQQCLGLIFPERLNGHR